METSQRNVEELSTIEGPKFILFFAEWCGDCQRTCEAIIATVNQAGAPLLKVPVGDSKAWKSPSHPYRQPHPQGFFVQVIPSVVYWDGSGINTGPRLAEELETATAEEAALLTSDFIRAYFSCTKEHNKVLQKC